MIVIDSSALLAILLGEPERQAFQDIIAGRERCINSRARLNLSDCAAYALAKTMHAPLLFKGDDFTHTDLRSYI